jgi:hypothetical protein
MRTGWADVRSGGGEAKVYEGNAVPEVRLEGMLFEGIRDLEEVELPEVPIHRVQPADAVL